MNGGYIWIEINNQSINNIGKILTGSDQNLASFQVSFHCIVWMGVISRIEVNNQSINNTDKILTGSDQKLASFQVSFHCMNEGYI